IGTPQMNVVSAAELPQLQTSFRDVPTGGYVGLRPENLALKPAGSGQVQGTVELVEALGAETLIYVNAGTKTPLVARQSTRPQVKVGDKVGVEIDAAAAHLFDAQGRLARQAAAVPN